MVRIYRGLLYLYPPGYRRDFADEMEYVFLQAEAEESNHSFVRRVAFCTREISGLVSGALRQRLFPSSDWNVIRRFNMRPGFRFPRSTVVMMCVILAGVLMAIQHAKIIVNKFGYRLADTPRHVISVWDGLPWFLFLTVGFSCVVVAVIWGVLFALRRDGMHRLNDLQT